MSRELEQWLLEERREGFKEGFKEGLKEGEDRVAALFKRMKADGRLQDFSDALKDMWIIRSTGKGMRAAAPRMLPVVVIC